MSSDFMGTARSSLVKHMWRPGLILLDTFLELLLPPHGNLLVVTARRYRGHLLLLRVGPVSANPGTACHVTDTGTIWLYCSLFTCVHSNLMVQSCIDAPLEAPCKTLCR